MKKFLKQMSVSGVVLALPMLALAQVNSVGQGFDVIIQLINRYVIPLIIGLAVVMFLWGVLKYVTSGGDEEKQEQGRNTMIYGIIAIAVMVSVWGLVRVLTGTFGLNNYAPSAGEIPTAPFPR